jgi:hypothetical protein
MVLPLQDAALLSRPGWSFSVNVLRISRSCIAYTARSYTVRWLLAYFLYMLVRLQLFGGRVADHKLARYVQRILVEVALWAKSYECCHY